MWELRFVLAERSLGSDPWKWFSRGDKSGRFARYLNHARLPDDLIVRSRASAKRTLQGSFRSMPKALEHMVGTKVLVMRLLDLIGGKAGGYEAKQKAVALLDAVTPDCDEVPRGGCAGAASWGLAGDALRTPCGWDYEAPSSIGGGASRGGGRPRTGLARGPPCEANARSGHVGQHAGPRIRIGGCACPVGSLVSRAICDTDGAMRRPMG